MRPQPRSDHHAGHELQVVALWEAGGDGEVVGGHAPAGEDAFFGDLAAVAAQRGVDGVKVVDVDQQQRERAPVATHGLHLVGEPRRSDEDVAAARARLDERSALVTAFQRHHVTFWTGQPDFFAWSPEEMIDTIRADGAFDVVAHPNRIRDTARMERVLAYAQGVEVYTSRHSETVSAKFLEYVKRHGKHLTASTDDHQHVRQRPYRPPPSGTPRATVERILEGA
mgnify:CR=1 FL=1